MVALLAVLFVCIAGTVAEAQPELTVDRVTVNWPTIELYFKVHCDGEQVYSATKQNVRIFENGDQIKEFTFWCSEPIRRFPVSIAFVCNVSASMEEGVLTPLATMKQAVRDFIYLMDGDIDEAAVIVFRDSVEVHQTMTTDKQLLHTAVDTLSAFGASALWDAAYRGVQELINFGTNPNRAVIVMTGNGQDTASSRDWTEVVYLANRNRIRIYTLGLGSPVDTMEVYTMANQTGGQHYLHPTSSQIPEIFEKISEPRICPVPECLITYQRDCMDGGLRTVDLRLVDVCNGNDTLRCTYHAPLDSSTFTHLNMRLEAEDTTVSLYSEHIPPGTVMHPFSFALNYDPSCVQFRKIQIPTGSLWTGAAITVTPHHDKIAVSVHEKRIVADSGSGDIHLLDVVFEMIEKEGHDTCDIFLGDPVFLAGCFVPLISPDTVHIIREVLSAEDVRVSRIFSPELEVYPEPATDILHIKLNSLPVGELKVMLCDVTGRCDVLYEGVVLSSIFNHSLAFERPSGVYYVVAYTQAGTLSQRVTKLK